MKTWISTLALGAVLVLSVAPADALAQDYRGWSRERHTGYHDTHRPNFDHRNDRHDGRRGRDWHNDRDIRHFDRDDLVTWKKGHWWKGKHGSKSGWWWIVGNRYYSYPRAVYPFPDPYTPSVIIANGRPAAASSWYYCRKPAGYYPYVQACRVPWKAVVRW